MSILKKEEGLFLETDGTDPEILDLDHGKAVGKKETKGKRVVSHQEFDDPQIAVVGVGGAGNNAVNNMIQKGGLEDVKFVVCNTDVQTLRQALCPVENRIQIGKKIAQGLGAGSAPEVGRLAAEENLADVLSALEGTHMLFVTAGMGGGTGTGAAPVIAKAARDLGILTVGVVTKPFEFEGTRRKALADEGVHTLEGCVDMLLVIPNQNLFSLATQQTSLAASFAMADDVLHQAVQTVTTLILKPGLINLDFADIRFVIQGVKGKSLMGTGEASGEDRALRAAENAIACPLLENLPLNRGAVSALINITGGRDMTLHEVSEATSRIKEELDPSAHIIFGATFDDRLEGMLRVSAIITGLLQEEVTPFLPNDPVPNTVMQQSYVAESSHEGSLGSRHGPQDSFFEEDFVPSLNLHEDSDGFSLDGKNGFGEGRNSLSYDADHSLSLAFPELPQEEKTRGFFGFFKRKKEPVVQKASDHLNHLKSYDGRRAVKLPQVDEFRDLMSDFEAKMPRDLPMDRDLEENSETKSLQNPSIPAFLRRDRQRKTPQK